MSSDAPSSSKLSRREYSSLRDLDRLIIEAARLDPAEFGHEVLGFKPAPFQREWHDLCSKHERLILFAPIEHGKDLDTRTPIPTPMASRPWVFMGDLRPGDRVFAGDGQPTSVVAATPHFTERECYEIRFADGGCLTAGSTHEWLAWSRWDRDEHRLPRVVTTEQMAAAGVRSGSCWRWKIPLAGPADFPARELPIDPYLLGVWLGNGTADNSSVTFNALDRDVIERATQAAGGAGKPRIKPWSLQVTLGPASGPWAGDGFRQALRREGLLRNKHIPSAYLDASIEQRRALLAGLLDTDGTVSKHGGKSGRISFSSTSAALATQVLSLVRSLGERAHLNEGDAKLNGRVISRHYRVDFTAHRNPFYCARKAARVVLGGPASDFRTIIGIKRVDTRPTCCITVSNADGTFLAGRDFTLTHNSSQLAVSRPMWELGHNPDLRIGIISSGEQQAKKFLGQIKANIVNNDRLHDIFPDLKPGPIWQETAVLVQRTRGAEFTQKDYSLQAIGYMGAILGSRLDIAILDDVLDFANTLSKIQRDKCYDWLKAVLLGRLVEGGKIWIIGTAWHEDDMVHRIAKEGVWHVERYEAGVPPCIWPEQWPPERLEAKRIELGDLEYNRQFRNIPLGEASGHFPIELVRECQRLWQDPPEWWYGQYSPDAFSWGVLGLDLGASAHSTGNESSIFVLGLGADGFKRPLHIRSGHWVGTDLLCEVIGVHRMHRNGVREWAVETNAAQLHVAAMLQDADIMRAAGATYEEAAGFSVYGIYTTVSRDQPRWGIKSMAPEMQALKWRIPRGQAEVERWIEEMKHYVPQEHPGDRLMASWFATQRMQGMGDPLPLMARSLSANALRRR